MKIFRKYILKPFTALMAILFILSVLSVDSASLTPLIVGIISGFWLAFYAWANGYMDGETE